MMLLLLRHYHACRHLPLDVSLLAAIAATPLCTRATRHDKRCAMRVTTRVCFAAACRCQRFTRGAVEVL